MDGRGEQQCSKEGGGERCLARERVRYWVGENVTGLNCGSLRDHSEDLLKINHADGIKLNGVGSSASDEGVQVDRGGDPLKFRHTDPVKFGELVAGLGPDYEEGCKSTLHKLFGSWSRSPDEPKTRRNQSV